MITKARTIPRTGGAIMVSCIGTAEHFVRDWDVPHHHRQVCACSGSCSGSCLLRLVSLAFGRAAPSPPRLRLLRLLLLLLLTAPRLPSPLRSAPADAPLDVPHHPSRAGPPLPAPRLLIPLLSHPQAVRFPLLPGPELPDELRPWRRLLKKKTLLGKPHRRRRKLRSRLQERQPSAPGTPPPTTPPLPDSRTPLPPATTPSLPPSPRAGASFSGFGGVEAGSDPAPVRASRRVKPGRDSVQHVARPPRPPTPSKETGSSWIARHRIRRSCGNHPRHPCHGRLPRSASPCIRTRCHIADVLAHPLSLHALR